MHYGDEYDDEDDDDDDNFDGVLAGIACVVSVGGVKTSYCLMPHKSL